MAVRCHRYTEVNTGGRDTAGRSRSASSCFFPLTTDALDILISRRASPPLGIPYSNSISPATTSQNATGATRTVKRVPRAVYAWPPHALQAGVDVLSWERWFLNCRQHVCCSEIATRKAVRGLKVLIRTTKRGNLIACKWQSGSLRGRGRHHREAATCGSAGILTLSQGSFHAGHSGSVLRTWSPFSLAKLLDVPLRAPSAVSRGSRGGWNRSRLAGVRVASRIQTFYHVQCNAFVELFCREDLESGHGIDVCEIRVVVAMLGGVTTGTIPHKCMSMSLAKCCAAEQSFSQRLEGVRCGASFPVASWYDVQDAETQNAKRAEATKYDGDDHE